MNWFQGEIVDAIVKSKQSQAIFVVYIEGKDEKSVKITEIIDEVAEKLGNDQFVAIKIEGDSVPYQQFTQIYKQVPVPSIYFIGKQGVPLEIVTEVSDAQSLNKILEQVLQKGGYTAAAQQTQNFISNEQAKEVEEKVQEGPSTSITHETPSPSTSEPSVEEKVEHAKQLIEKKREEKQKDEEENEKAKELERRKMGQSVQQLKRWQEDQELKNVLEERQKEKRENQKARDRILEQIAQDKAERAAKFNPQPQQQQPQPTPPTARPPTNSNTARLQFRMPDGRTATQDFPSSDSLESVHAHIRSNLNLGFTKYTLSTTFPRREFTDGDRSQSLLDLGLTPTAVILVLPVNKGVVSTSGGDGLTGLFWSFLSPVIAVLGYIRTFIFGGNNSASPANSESNKRPAASSSRTEGQSKVRRSGETTVIRRQGNVHRLSNKNDSDDENNTWNGNSTQQM